MTPWPSVRFQSRNGMTQSGLIAHANDEEAIIAINTEPKLIPGPFGLKLQTIQYITVKLQYLL